jgi:hypothetical protein
MLCKVATCCCYGVKIFRYAYFVLADRDSGQRWAHELFRTAIVKLPCYFLTTSSCLVSLQKSNDWDNIYYY